MLKTPGTELYRHQAEQAILWNSMEISIQISGRSLAPSRLTLHCTQQDSADVVSLKLCPIGMPTELCLRLSRAQPQYAYIGCLFPQQSSQQIVPKVDMTSQQPFKESRVAIFFTSSTVFFNHRDPFL